MKTILFLVIVLSGTLFAQYYRYVQIETWHLIQRNIEIRFQLNQLRYKFDVLRQHTDDIQLELNNAKTS